MTQDYFFTIEKPALAEFKERGSKFLAHCFPIGNVDNFKGRLAEIKKDHPKATHHCFAYRIGSSGDIFRVSDDGEPSGSAGRPILGQIDSRQLVNLAVVVVRYFGGTLLGIPGLINAYKTSAALVLQMTPVVQQFVEEEFSLHFDYTQINPVMTLVKYFDCRIIEQEMQLYCHMKISIPRNRVEEFMYRSGEMKNLEIVRR
jgi:uncharacterized YigZ family protein